MTHEKTQEALLKIIDSLKPELDSSELSLLSGTIGAIHAEPDRADVRISKAISDVADALGRVSNDRGFKYGLRLSSRALRTAPPVVELIVEEL